MVCQKKIEKNSKFESLKGQDARKSVTVIVGLFCCTGSLSVLQLPLQHPPHSNWLHVPSFSSLSLSLSPIAAVTSSTGKYLQQFNCSQFCLFLTGLWIASFSCVCAPASSRISSTPLSSCCSTSWYWLFSRIPSALLLLLHLVVFQSSVLEYICKEEIGLLTRISLFLGMGGEGVHCKMLFTRMQPGLMT